jgi:mannose-6-phosphate isomerase-like protein (cupin superfamily)
MTEYDTHLDIKYAPLERMDIQQLADATTHPWHNQSLCKMNNTVVRMGVLQGEYHWHQHDDTDEFFLVLEGQLLIDVEDHETIELNARQAVTIPTRIRHRPRAPERTIVVMAEAAGTGD